MIPAETSINLFGASRRSYHEWTKEEKRLSLGIPNVSEYPHLVTTLLIVHANKSLYTYTSPNNNLSDKTRQGQTPCLPGNRKKLPLKQTHPSQTQPAVIHDSRSQQKQPSLQVQPKPKQLTADSSRKSRRGHNRTGRLTPASSDAQSPRQRAHFRTLTTASG